MPASIVHRPFTVYVLMDKITCLIRCSIDIKAANGCFLSETRVC
jgi:hypothetical protein